MSQEQYKIWSEAWKIQRPGRQCPTFEQINEMMKLFSISVDELGLENI